MTIYQNISYYLVFSSKFTFLSQFTMDFLASGHFVLVFLGKLHMIYCVFSDFERDDSVALFSNWSYKSIPVSLSPLQVDTPSLGKGS